MTVKSSDQTLQMQNLAALWHKSLQVRKQLECDVVAPRGFMTAKIPAEKVFVQFKK